MKILTFNSDNIAKNDLQHLLIFVSIMRNCRLLVPIEFF